MEDELLRLAQACEESATGARLLDRMIGEAVSAPLADSGDLVGLGYARFTSSIDAALTLVPEGWSVGGLWEAVKAKDRPWWGVDLRYGDGEPGSDYRLVTIRGAKSAALALCAAALRARAAQAERG